MRKLILTLALMAVAGVAVGQETRTEVTKATTAADDSKPNSDAVPDAFAISGQFERVVILRFKYQTDLLAGLEKMVKQEKIRNGVILSGIGSLRGYHFHVISNRTFPTKNILVKNPTAPADLVGMNGYVIDGRVHAHMTLSNADKAFGGHLESGTEVFTFVVVTIGVLNDKVDLSRIDDKTYRVISGRETGLIFGVARQSEFAYHQSTLMDIKLPSLGEGADSGTVVNILVKVGDQIQKEQSILELETEKAVGSIPAPSAGTVQAIRVKVGDKISAGQVIMTVDEGAGATAPAAPKPTVARPAPAPAVASVAPKAIPGIPAAASPTVRKLAAQLGLDLSQIPGSEAGGRISLEDVRGYIQRLQAGSTETKKPAAERVDFAQFGPVSKKPISSLRKTIARRMGESWSAVPRVTQFDEADITKLNELRKKQGFTLTVYAIKAVVNTLKKHPLFNSSLDEAADEIVLKEYFHIGIAVDTEHGLMVPVIRNVDNKSLLDISKELEDLAGKTRDRKLAADQMKGGSFTISNQGGIGSGAFTPIVNKPEVAILGMGRGAMKPVVTSAGKIEPRLMLPLALSYDHRVIDGGSAARFMVDLVAAFQNFDEKGI